MNGFPVLRHATFKFSETTITRLAWIAAEWEKRGKMFGVRCDATKTDVLRKLINDEHNRLEALAIAEKEKAPTPAPEKKVARKSAKKSNKNATKKKG
jgi:hypothetical protein